VITMVVDLAMYSVYGYCTLSPSSIVVDAVCYLRMNSIRSFKLHGTYQ
jgi:hypothetical protein